ncbi:MAG: Hsp70 family protein [Alphaproteobacteria bacterium]|nr:Hsp70 family protein [Alphaproteobacteria bacterium]
MDLGIDFGTTRTVVAVADRGNFPVVQFETADGDVFDHFPSVAASDGTSLVFGHDAVAKLEQPGWTGLRSFKRLLARPDAASCPKVAIGALEIGLDELLVSFLTALREALVHRSTCPVNARKKQTFRTFVAVPARASSAQRFLTLEAFRRAGFQVAGLMNEPSAAGIEYAHRYAKTFTSSRSQVLVYDLGGGTFDISLVEMGDDRHTVLDNAGVNRLGGEDFDRVLLKLALDEAGPQKTDETALLERCRVAKEALTPNSRKVGIDLDEETVQVDVKAFYEASRPLVDQTIDTIGEVLAAGTDERFDTTVLAGVYVVGGGSDLPAVSRQLKEVFGRRVKRSSYASGATAVGLAIAASDQAPEVHERFSRTFGVFREIASGTDVAFDPILTRDTKLEPTGTEWTRRYRPVHNVGHFRFAECDAMGAKGTPIGDLTPFAELRFPFDPSLRESDLSKVEIAHCAGLPLVEERYRVDDNGIVSVKITDLESGWSREERL